MSDRPRSDRARAPSFDDPSIRSSLTPIISEDDFRPLASARARGLISALTAPIERATVVNKLYFFALLYESERFESFLYDHGARTNLRWSDLIGLVASIRNYAVAGFHISHALERYPDYVDFEPDSLQMDFTDASTVALDHIRQTIGRFYEAIVFFAKANGMKLDSERAEIADWRLSIAPKLPYTITGRASTDEREKIVSICQAYRRARKEFRMRRLSGPFKITSLDELIPTILNETTASNFEAALHNIQSEYDTHVADGEFEKSNRLMRAFRSRVSIPMHLFEATRWLTHFVERHQEKVSESASTERDRELVDREALFAALTSYALKYIDTYMKEGARLAESILSLLVDPVTIELNPPRPNGLHARPATYLSLIAQEHGVDMSILLDGARFDCRSVLEIMEAGALMAERSIERIKIEGDRRALEDIKILAEHNWCEDQDIPPALNYIRIMRNL